MKALLLSAAILALPAVAFASPLAPGDADGGAGSLAPGAMSVMWTYEPTGPLTLSYFFISGTGNSAGADLSKVTYYLDSMTTSYVPTPTSGFAANEVTGFEGLTFTSPFSIWVTLDASAARPIFYTFSFETIAADVPLPAGFVLLGAVVAGTGVMARRRKTQ